MLLLALDTATAATCVALHDGSSVLACRSEVDARRHAEVLAPLVAAVLADAGARPGDLTGVVCGVGPGPYTGLRAGIVTARVLGAVLGIDVVGACSLDAVAASALALDGCDRPVGVATDARRREVYWAAYDCDGVRVDGPHVGRPAEVAAAHPGLRFAGEGALAHPDLFPGALGPARPDAGVLAALTAAELLAGMRIGDGRLLPAEPLYLRAPDARVPGAPKRVTR